METNSVWPNVQKHRNRKVIYVCQTCDSMKTIVAHPTKSTEEFQQELPLDVICGVGGCVNRCQRTL